MKRPVDSDSPPTTDKAKKAKKAKREAVTDTATPSSSTTTSTSESLAVTSDAARKEAKKAKKQRKEKAKKEDEAAPPIAKEDVQVKNDTKVKEKEKKTKRKKKSKRETSGPLPTPGEGARAAPGPAAAATAVFFEDAVQAIIARVAQDGSPTLSDLLNPDHGAFDAELKAQWKSLPKKGRAAIVAADQGRIADLRRAGEEALSRLPYTTEPGSPLASAASYARLRLSLTPPR